MVKISEVHPTLAHSMVTTIRILEAAIEWRQKEIANMQSCVRECHKVMADEVMPSDEQSADLQREIADKMDNALGEERQLTKLQRAMKRVGSYEQQEHTNGGPDR